MEHIKLFEQFITEGALSMDKSKIKPFIKDLENADNAKDVKKIQSKYSNLVDDELMDYLDQAIRAKDISSDDFQDAIADAIARLRDFRDGHNLDESELYEKNFQVIIGDNTIEYTLRENIADNGIIALPSNSKELDKEIESGVSKTAIAKDIKDSINSRLKKARLPVTVKIDHRYEGTGYGFKLDLADLLQKLNK
jgi:hypothetical protein